MGKLLDEIRKSIEGMELSEEIDLTGVPIPVFENGAWKIRSYIEPKKLVKRFELIADFLTFNDHLELSREAHDNMLKLIKGEEVERV